MILRMAGLKLKISKCKFLYNRISLLGFLVNPEGIQPDPDKVDSIVSMPTPNTVSKLRSFLAMINFYRKFIPKLAETPKPLYELLETGKVSIIWEPRQQVAFKALKQKLAEAPLLVHYDSTLPLEISCNACEYGIAGSLYMVKKIIGKSGRERRIEVPLQYVSRTLREAERKWPICELEMLSLMFCLAAFRPFIAMREFTVRTDSKSLTFLKEARNPLKSRIARWAVKLNEFNCNIVYLPGKANKVADGLSRNPSERMLDADEMLEIPSYSLRIACNPDGKEYELGGLTNLRLAKMQALDNWCSQMIGEEIDDEIVIKKDGLIVVPRFHGELLRYRVLLPVLLRGIVISQFHDPTVSGHLGIVKTLAKLRDRFLWPAMKDEVTKFINNCTSCKLHKSVHRKKSGMLQPIFPFSALDDLQPGDFVSTDLHGHRFIDYVCGGITN
jgi:hypothetical protein